MNTHTWPEMDTPLRRFAAASAAGFTALGSFGAAVVCGPGPGPRVSGGVLVAFSAGTLAVLLVWWLLGRPRAAGPAEQSRPAAPDRWLFVGSAIDGGASAECFGCCTQLGYVPQGAGFAGDNLLTLWSRHRDRCPRRGHQPARSTR